VATGPIVESTLFTVPMEAPPGQYDLSVVANGIASDPVTVSITAPNPLRHFKLPYYAAYIGKLIGSFGDGPLYVLGPNGPIPVDPQWPGGDAMATRATSAWRQIQNALTALETLGRQAVA